jgi:hypothetical protein
MPGQVSSGYDAWPPWIEKRRRWATGRWDSLPDAQFEVTIRKKAHPFALDDELADRLAEVAKAQKRPAG